MLKHNLRGWIGGLSLFVFLVSGLWQAPAAAEETAKKPAQALISEGDKLADETKYADALLRYKEAYQQIVPELRGLAFKEAVNPGLMSRAELQKHMAALVAEEIPAEKMVLMDRSLKVFGFVPMSLTVEKMLLGLYTEEVAGFYHPKTKRIFLITDVDKPQDRGLFGALFGGGSAFNKDEQKIALAHEMAHALADQHFDLDRMQSAAKHDEDMELALAALIEGEATLVMMQETARELGDPAAVLKISPQYMKFSFGLMRFALPFATGKTFRNSPLIFRESLIFPYLSGMVFVLHLTNRDEWDLVNRAFVSPPLSTEQILHPEKYLFPQDVPMALAFADLKPAVGESWKELGQNVLGEFQTSILLADHQGNDAAAGWDGDRYAVFEDASGRLALVWLSTWDSVAEAKEFASAYGRYLPKKLNPKKNAPKAGKGEDATPSDPVTRIQHADRVYHVERRGQDVLIVEGFSDGETGKLIDLAFQAKKQAKTFELAAEAPKKE